MAKNLTILEAQEALERARQFEAEQVAAERAEAERRAQAQHDADHERLVADLERQADKVISEALLPSSIDRGASESARIFLHCLPSPAGQFGDDRLSLAVRHDPPAAALHALFENTVSTHNRLTVNRKQGTRRISIELGERLFGIERRLWGQLIRRLRVIAGEVE